ncbi:chitinase-like protein Idgf1 [Calliphora vicina]|uniref:chitinase-like protein Idgf1 n=1 Tax=Calliphora vicina TaxID=7373 RepID=UPI00325A7011
MLKTKILLLLIVGILYYSKSVLGQQTPKRLVCYYDALNPVKDEYAHYFEKHFPKALSNCTHLVYSFAQILPQTFEIRKFRVQPKPRDLKIQFPHLKIFLSVGGDKLNLKSQYLQFLEAGVVKQKQFNENAKTFLKLNHFDGLDLAFPLPHNKPRKVHTGFDRVVKNIKKLFTDDEIVDANAGNHKLQYTNFVRALKNDFVKANLQLSMTVLPNVNSTWYFDIFKIHKNFEFINLFAFDFLTPKRNPEEADYTAPIYFKNDANRLPHYNIEYQVNHWIQNGCPANKLNLGIATYGRTWKMTTDSGLSGKPVVESTAGPAYKGKLTQTPGLLSWSEICIKLDTKNMLQKVVDVQGKYGNYAFRPADKNGNDGIWISYDDPEFAGIKTEYIMQRGLGGVALYDLYHDDFQRFCMGPAFPILSRISQGLGILHQVHKHNLKGPTYTNQVYPEYALKKPYPSRLF